MTSINQVKNIISLYSHIPNFISIDISFHLLSLLRDGMKWKKFLPSPKSRLCVYWEHGDFRELDILLEGIIVQIQQIFQVNIKGVFLNWYKNGQDYCPYHSDKYNCDVFTISLGQTRDLLIKYNGPGKAEKFTLNSGDLYYMSNEMQLTHKHSIPIRKNVIGDRISIVFFARKNQ